MKTPPFLVGAALLFWGWQTDYMVAGAIMAVILEGSRVVKARWELSDDDFSRIWTLCSLLLLGAVVYAFTDSGGPTRFGSLFENSSAAALARASAVGARTASAMLRWLPMVLFLFVAAQVYSTRSRIPVSTISMLLRRRWNSEKKLGYTGRLEFNSAYPYFALCLFSASVHSPEDASYFWGLCALLAWGLWTHRSRRYGIATWASALVVSIALGFYGQTGISHLQNYVQSLDTQWLARWMGRRTYDAMRAKTQIGAVGSIKTSDAIAIRLETKNGETPPRYLREATYRRFKSPIWSIGTPRDDFQRVNEDPRGSRVFPLDPNKPNERRLQIACYLDGNSRETDGRTGLLPLPIGTFRLENLAAFEVKQNSFRAVLAEGPGLVVFDACYNPLMNLDSPFDPEETHPLSGHRRIRSEGDENSEVPLRRYQRFRSDGDENPETRVNWDLFVESDDASVVDQIIPELKVDGLSTRDVLTAVQAFFQNNFQYSLWQEEPSRNTTNDTALGRFLLETRSGHCEYFATATVLLLRRLGIPARYAVGYAVHEEAGSGYVVRFRDAHAWCLVWDAEKETWRNFDTTPASWIDAESSRRSPLQRLADLWSWCRFQISKFRWGQTNLRPYLLAALVPAVVMLSYQIVARRSRGRSMLNGSGFRRGNWPGQDSEFYLVEKKLATRVRRRSDEPLSDWIERALSSPALENAREPVRKALNLHYRYRFDPRSLDADARGELRRRSAECLEKLRG